MKYVIILDPGVGAGLPPGTYPPFDEGLGMNIFIKNSSDLPLMAAVSTYRFLEIPRYFFIIDKMTYRHCHEKTYVSNFALSFYCMNGSIEGRCTNYKFRFHR